MRKLKRAIFFRLYYAASCVYIPVMFFFAWRFGELRHLNGTDLRVWLKSMLKMLRSYSRAGYNFRMHEILHAFALDKFEKVRQRPFEDKGSPIVTLCVKNDIDRIKMLVSHYRAAGVERFAILDNDSTDGTFGWLKEQDDVDLYRTRVKYRTAVKEGWINRLVSYYGFDRWYVITDSDELMLWAGMEQHDIRELIKYGESHGIRRFKGLTLDMYPDRELFSGSDDIRSDYRYADSDSYYIRDSRAGGDTIRQYYGGPRYRMMEITVPLSKYPLCYFEKGTVSSSAHFFYPHITNEPDECFIGIMHFKFIDKDLKECQRRAQKDSGFSSNGLHYRKLMEYMQEKKDVSFMYEGTIDLSDTKNLSKVRYIRPIDF